LTKLEFWSIVAGVKGVAVGVEPEFSSLEAKVAQFVALCERLRAENVDLRRQLAAAQSDAKRLNEKIDGAKARLEGLLNRLPG
jgi:cell division protein ZapB